MTDFAEEQNKELRERIERIEEYVRTSVFTDYDYQPPLFDREAFKEWKSKKP